MSPNNQEKIQALGAEILKRMDQAPKTSLFSKDYWYGNIMDWSMRNQSFKTQMFRFVDVLPTLSSSSEVATHLKEYFAEGGDELPKVFNFGVGLGSLAPSLMAGAIRKNVTQMATLFIAGESGQEALPVLKKARKNQIGFTVDILGEATLSEREALEYQSRYLQLIEWLAEDSKKWEEVPLLDRDALGSIPKVNVSVKLTSVFSQINDRDWDGTKKMLKERLRPILRKAQEQNVFLNLDMEHYAVKHLTIEVWTELIMEEEFRRYPHFGCVIQAYLRDAMEDLSNLVQIANRRGTPFTVRLVKGAYWDSETIEAQQKGWPIPVFQQKWESDQNFEACAEFLLSHYPSIRVALGSHNVRSLAAALVAAEKHGVPKAGLEVQMLFGMGEPIKRAMVDLGYRVREYAPVGDLIPGMAYLVRRLLENTSNESWLRGKFSENLSIEKLLRAPGPAERTPSDAASLVNSATTTPAMTSKVHTPASFQNEAVLDFAVAANRQGVSKAIQEARRQFPASVPLVVNGNRIVTDAKLRRENPSNTRETVAEVSCADEGHLKLAMDAIRTSLPAWANAPVETRAKLLDALADKMQERRHRLIAEQVLEVGKPWDEADGDVAEAIDFCRYYGGQMRSLAIPTEIGSIAGENNQYMYRPRGVCAVIAPWNFPLAILTGMATAALVTGNAVIMKPAEQSSWVAKTLIDMLLEVGVPKGVVHFLPGVGEKIGAALVAHPEIQTIVFTGSKAVGLSILQSTALPAPGQKFIKRAILELGGKNAIIVDGDADLDEAVGGVLHSAFGFAGQKCSACSRVVVLDSIFDKFLERLSEATKSIRLGPADDPSVYYGPVVDAEAKERILAFVAEQKTRGFKSVFLGEQPAGGHFVAPAIFADVPADSNLAQQEIFGPVLAVIRAKDLTEALRIANESEYALTGGLYSRSPENIRRVRSEFQVGNLYINRGITGAMVQRHPFGGFRMSGIGSKAGGPDYLKQFLEPRAISENTMRRGFAPEVSQ